MQGQNNPEDIRRRQFLAKSITAVCACGAAAVPLGAAFRVLTDPLGKGASSGAKIRITNLAALPPDGIPRKFPVITSKTDAWNKFANVPVGAVYLRRTKEDIVEALNVVCPHAGCFVDYSSEEKQFLCPCHKSSFKLDGSVANAGSPSPRGLDSLMVEVREGGNVWVEFLNFQAGRSDKVPAS